MDSILTTVKHLLGIEEDYTHFDTDVIIGVNSALATLNQVGVGQDNFSISDSTAKWSDFLGEQISYESVKSYVYLKTRLMFDPPQSSAHIDSINKQIAELEWRIMINYDKPEADEVEEPTG
jgi:hypothetical protein